MAKFFCEKCGRTMDADQFYTSKNLEKYPNGGKLHQCKKCLTMHVDNWDPETFKPILKEIDVPYIAEEWNSLLAKYGKDRRKVTGTTILGRYLSKMKLNQWKELTWADTDTLEEQARSHKANIMRSAGFTEEQIAEEMTVDRTPQPEIDFEPSVVTAAPVEEPDEDEIEITKNLTEEDQLYLRLKWGKGYSMADRVRMERFYQNMMNSYDIQGAGHEDNLILLCKTSLKANRLIDIEDIEGYQKLSRVYDTLMKSGKFTAAQNKIENKEEIDSVGELVALCEKEGFIPRYYIDEPKDKVDRTLEDLKKYNRTLVMEEMNLGDMIEKALKEIQEDKIKENSVDIDEDELFSLENQLFSKENEFNFNENGLDFLQDLELAEEEGE